MPREVRVFGPPGTGKTTTLAGLVREAAKERGSDAVIVASFTRAAAVEIAGRDLPIDREQVGTLHAMCYRALGKPPIAETKIAEWNEWIKGIEGSSHLGLSDDGLEREHKDDPYGSKQATAGDESYADMQRLRAMMVPLGEWLRTTPAKFKRRWDQWKEENGYIDFTDMIEIALRELPEAPGSPSIGIFDEVQDFSGLELSLIRKWAEHMDEVVLAGDDDQCIYHFLGATPDAFLKPPVLSENKIILAQSYRVPRAIHEVSQIWVRQLRHREPKEYRPRDYEGSVERTYATYKSPHFLAGVVEKYLSDGKRMMFLGSCGYMLGPLIAQLRSAGIPFWNPYRKRHGGWNPLGTSRRGATTAVQRVMAFLVGDERTYGKDARLWQDVGELTKWTDAIRVAGALKPGVKASLKKMDPETPINIEHLLAWFEEGALRRALASDLEWFGERLTKAHSAMEYPLEVAEKRGPAALRNDPQVIVGTIHSVKGGEADVVFLFPDLSLRGAREWGNIRGGGHDAVIRQFYVGMTRARESLIVCAPVSGRAVPIGRFC